MVSYAYFTDLILQIILLNHFWQMHNIIIKVAIISSFKLYRYVYLQYVLDGTLSWKEESYPKNVLHYLYFGV